MNIGLQNHIHARANEAILAANLFLNLSMSHIHTFDMRINSFISIYTWLCSLRNTYCIY